MRTSDFLRVPFVWVEFLSVILSLGMIAPHANANHIMIDTFNNPVGQPFFVPGVPPWGNGEPAVIQQPEIPDPPLAEIIGGQREVLISVEGDPLPISAAGIIGYDAVYDVGLLQIATFGEPGTRVVVQYDGLDDDPDDQLFDAELLGGLDLTDGSSDRAIELSFSSIDAGDGTTLRLKVSVKGGGGSDSAEYDVPESTIASTFSVPFSDFDASLFSSVDSLAFAFNDLIEPVPNVDFELDSIGVVPEPSILAMLSGVGALVLLTGLCRQRKQAR